MAAERTRSAELAKTMADHIFRHEHVVEHFAVMNGERVTDEVRHDHGTTGPRLMGAFSFLAFKASTFFFRCSSTNGPFLIERDDITSSSAE